MRLNNWFLLICVAICVVVAAAAENVESESGALQSGESARARFVLPKLFDFARYKELFKKRYESVVEELARQKIVLAKAFQSLISMVKYKCRKVSHYLGVNQMSDRTQAELDALKIHSDRFRRNVSDEREEAESSDPSGQDSPQTQAASLEDIEQVVAEVEKLKNEPGYKEIAEEFERAQGQVRSKRETAAQNSHRSSLGADDLMRSPEAEEESLKIRRRVPSNNPTYEPPELDSFGVDDEEPKSTLSESVISMLGEFPGASYLKSLVGGAVKSLVSARSVEKSDVTDTVYFDHRDSQCFFLPRGQGNCGCCYAFAAISLYEYDFCKQTGFLVPFSEQYIVDCGHTVNAHGCDGALIDRPLEFTEKYGLILRADYPYRTKVDQCPYNQDIDLESTGYIRMKRPGFKLVHQKMIDSFLKDRPVLIAIMLPTDFSSYGGGVDEALSCSKDNGHAMLMVGAGREDGKEYYLIRNSHSVSWGEQGHWKLSKDGFKRCLLDNLGIITTSKFTVSKNPDELPSNPNYSGETIKTRYQAYMNMDVLGA